jgi:predicted nucleic acid-binding Zn ribbon protein
LEDTHFTEIEKSKSQVKAMMIIFFDIRGIIMIEWIPEGKLVIKSTCLEVLTKLQERVRRKEAGIVEEEIMDSASR